MTDYGNDHIDDPDRAMSVDDVFGTFYSQIRSMILWDKLADEDNVGDWQHQVYLLLRRVRPGIYWCPGWSNLGGFLRSDLRYRRGQFNPLREKMELCGYYAARYSFSEYDDNHGIRGAEEDKFYWLDVVKLLAKHRWGSIDKKKKDLNRKVFGLMVDGYKMGEIQGVTGISEDEFKRSRRDCRRVLAKSEEIMGGRKWVENGSNGGRMEINQQSF